MRVPHPRSGRMRRRRQPRPLSRRRPPWRRPARCPFSRLSRSPLPPPPPSLSPELQRRRRSSRQPNSPQPRARRPPCYPCSRPRRARAGAARGRAARHRAQGLTALALAAARRRSERRPSRSRAHGLAWSQRPCSMGQRKGRVYPRATSAARARPDVGSLANRPGLHGHTGPGCCHRPSKSRSEWQRYAGASRQSATW